MARNFNGSSDFIELGTGVRGSDVQKLHVAAWVNPAEKKSQSVMSRWDNTTNETWLLTLNAAGKVDFTILDAGFAGHTLNGVTDIGTGSWAHVGGSYDGTTIRVFVNGAQDASSVLSVTIRQSAAATVRIGQHAGTNWFHGDIAEAHIMLDVENVAAYMAALSIGYSPKEIEGISTHDHIGYWPLLGDSPEPDLSGNLHNGTVTGTTVVYHPPVRSVTAFQS